MFTKLSRFKVSPQFNLIVLSIFLTLSGCIPIEKIVLLQGEEEINSNVCVEPSDYRYTLQQGDILDVRITSVNPEINAIYNSSSIATMQMVQATAQTGGDLFYVTGYSVDPSGQVDIPLVGPVHVEGATINEAKSLIDSTVATLFSNYHLEVKLGGIRFSGLGELSRPGKHVAMQNQLNIFEAIALCGDFTRVANRSDIKIIRRTPSGTTLHNVSLLDENILQSPFYFVQSGDVIYVEPLVQKSWGIGITGAESVSTIISALSTSLALILSIVSLSR